MKVPRRASVRPRLANWDRLPEGVGIVERAAAERLLRLIGLGVRARNVVVGVEQVRTAAKKGSLELAVVAPDASANSLEKIVPLLRARRVKFVEGPTAAELGAAVGREQTAAVGVIDPQLARGIRELVGDELR